MEEKYIRMANIFKALSDPKRVQIIDMLSDGEKCACTLLEHFQIAQPTLSHDMKLLMNSGVVKSRREGQRTLYSLNMESLKGMQKTLKRMLQCGADAKAEEDKAGRYGA